MSPVASAATFAYKGMFGHFKICPFSCHSAIFYLTNKLAVVIKKRISKGVIANPSTYSQLPRNRSIKNKIQFAVTPLMFAILDNAPRNAFHVILIISIAINTGYKFNVEFLLM